MRRALVDGTGQTAVLTFFMPKEHREHHWSCRFSLKRAGQRVLVDNGWGVDAVQAVSAALHSARKLLVEKGADLRWLSDVAGEHGLPVVAFSPFGLKLDRKLQKAVDTEIDRFARAIIREKKKRLAAQTHRSKRPTGQ